MSYAEELNDIEALIAAHPEEAQALADLGAPQPASPPGPLDAMLASAEPTVHQAKDIGPVKKPIKPLQTYTADTLYGVTLERPPIIVPGMLPAGLTVLAAAPKRGKSWLALGLGISVAAGAPFMGVTCRQGDVLYLDLESRQYRVQDRLTKLLPGKGPARLHITHDADRLDADLLPQIEEWAGRVPEPALVIIDTLGRVKGGSKRGENAYEGDTRILGEVQRFAMDHKLAVMCIHHLRKSNGSEDDPFEKVTGSMGITGACDAVWMLNGKRGESVSPLSISSRDFEPAEIILEFKGGLWELQSTDSEAYRAEQEYRHSPVVRDVLRLMEATPSWQGTPAELLDTILDITHEAPGNGASAPVYCKELFRLCQQLYDRDLIHVYYTRVGRYHKRIIKIEKINPMGF